MTLAEGMTSVQTIVERGLWAFFRQKRTEAQRIHSESAHLVRVIEEFTLRPAKRLRPFLCWVGWSGRSRVAPFSAADLPQPVIAAMLALELFHTFALVHDDIMDEEKTRRGGPTVHEVFKSTVNLKTDGSVHAARFGESIGILAGDLALAWADEQMRKTRSDAAQELYSTMKEEVLFGQQLDVIGALKNGKISKSMIDELKTARYTIIRPLQIGAALGGASKQESDMLASYGRPVGMLFQMRDDVLDGQMSETLFFRKAPALSATARGALNRARMAPWAKQLLAELVQFVQERKS